MATRTSILSIASPFEHFNSRILNPIRPRLLNKRFHESEKNRQENKPNKEDEYLESTMRKQIEGHDIAGTQNRIEQIRDDIHQEDECARPQKAVRLHVGHNAEIVVEECCVIPSVEYKCDECDESRSD